MQQQAFNPKDYPIVVAIDFGTTFSGCAYAYAQDDKEVIDITSWPKQNIQYPKTPTLNLYKKDDPENKLVAWGWRAKMETLKPTARHHTLLYQYKLHLDENQQSAPLDVDITVLEAISHYLDAFHEYVVGEIMRGFAKNFQRDHFRYCLTVTKGHGASCGSVFLDRHMRRLLEEKFGHHAANFPANIIPNLVDTFADVIKPQFDGLEDQFLQLPANR
ncbi:hypothetical protein BGZ70_003211, partial [Mortierella alpina]